MDNNPVVTRDSAVAQISKAGRFITYVIERIQKDKGFAARLKRADNQTTEYQSWELLASFDVDLEKEWERLPYCIVGAALAKAKPKSNGHLTLGQAIAACYDDGNQSEQAKARLRRLLACSSSTEVCRILRPLLTLIESKGVALNYHQLLEQLLWYHGKAQDSIRARWAQDFYRRSASTQAHEVNYE
ncbi:TPA: type I-E CRISPR-associated protein Cse2/CasB [Vibrio vulnificus]|uniref:type I-E CRISPR-associated protein Cse2/CasB n=1 Tax=Vibrio vulnificus TaxID=672 RepID=UPI0028CEC6E9|nr:type I-E CRISPR-associated protein Cse2/CasB [Vibrio vulnificus]